MPREARIDGGGPSEDVTFELRPTMERRKRSASVRASRYKDPEVEMSF